MSETLPNPPPQPDKIYKEIIREGLEAFREMKDKSDFLPWICKISEEVQTRMYGQQIIPKKKTSDDENYEEE